MRIITIVAALAALAGVVRAAPAADTADTALDPRDAAHLLAKRAEWPGETGTQLYTGSGGSSCLTVGLVEDGAPVYVEDCSGSNFPGWMLPDPGSAGEIRLANTLFCLDAGPASRVRAHALLTLRACGTTGPCRPTIGNAQIWWGLQGSVATDYWIELAGARRTKPRHSGLCVTADLSQQRATVAPCSPNNTHVTDVNQLWSPNMHG